LLDGRLSVFQRNFVRAMGLWATPQRLFLTTIAQIWRLENVLGPGQLATQKNIHYERLYVPRMSHTTGDVDAHELGVDAKDRLIFVNTKYSCLATLDPVTASSRCGSRNSSPSSRRRIAVTSMASPCRTVRRDMSPPCRAVTWWMAGASGGTRAVFSSTWRTTAW
jgi:hypothetical protein